MRGRQQREAAQRRVDRWEQDMADSCPAEFARVIAWKIFPICGPVIVLAPYLRH